MGDQSTQTTPSGLDNPMVVNIQNNLMEILEFSKKQQWAITNYSVLVYAAIFAITHADLTPAIRPTEKWIASLLVFLTWLCALVLLGKIQPDMGNIESVCRTYISNSSARMIGKPQGSRTMDRVPLCVAGNLC